MMDVQVGFHHISLNLDDVDTRAEELRRGDVDMTAALLTPMRQGSDWHFSKTPMVSICNFSTGAMGLLSVSWS